MKTTYALHLLLLAVIDHARSTQSAEFTRRIFAQTTHNVGNFLRACSTCKGSAYGLVEIVAIALIKLIHSFIEIESLLSIVARHLYTEHGCSDCVFVACMRARKIPVGFLKSKEEAILFMLITELIYLVTNILKTGEYASELKIPLTRKGSAHIGRDDRRYADLL